MIALPGRVFLVTGFFPIFTLNILCHCLLACRLAAEKSSNSLLGVLLYIPSCFSLAAFNVLFNFCHFNYSVSLFGSLWFGLVEDSLCFLDLDVCFLSQVREVFSCYVFKHTLCNFLSLLLLGPL